ncbi:MAG: TIM barrel protein [Chloroflexota bacterium]
MTVSFYRHSWGAVGNGAKWPTLPAFVHAAAAEGYAGVEVPFGDFHRGPASPSQTEEDFRQALAETNLRFFPLIQTSAQPRSDYAGHLDSFRTLVARAQTWGARAAAVHIGDDSFDDETSIRFFRDATTIARDGGIEPYFETHRGRPMYNPYRTVKILEALPDIWLTADFAHWIPVLERLPHDLAELFELCAARTAHIHARVGHEEGGQVPDPRDPLWEGHIQFHEALWDHCVAHARNRGQDIAITPEFGPFPFLLHQPYTETPLADLADIVAWMQERLQQRYKTAP